MKFIFSHANLVDADIMQGMINNQDRDLSLALIQIHERSLRNARKKSSNNQYSGQVKSKESYADMVRKSSNLGQAGVVARNIQTKPTTDWKPNKKLFFTNLSEEISVPEIWKTFKQFGQISDIILPQKRDRFGNRFGFILSKSNTEATSILKKASMIKFQGKFIKMEWARIINNHRSKDRYPQDIRIKGLPSSAENKSPSRSKV